MDRRSLLAMTLCLLIFIGWQKFYFEPQMAAQKAAVQTQSSVPEATPPVITTATVMSDVGSTPTEKFPSISRPLHLRTGTAQVSNGHSFFSDWTLKAYKLDIAADAAVDMDSVTNEAGEVEVEFDKAEYAGLSHATGNLTETSLGYLWTYEDDKVKLTREFVGNETTPFAKVTVNAQFKGQAPHYLFLTLNSRSALADKDPQIRDRQLLYWSGDSIERNPLKETMALKEVGTPVKWIAATNRYFLLSVINDSELQPKALIRPLKEPFAGAISLVYPITGNSITVPLKAYFGPKELDTLREVEPTLDHTVDFGWFTIFAYPLLRIMKMFYGLVGNWGLSIIFLTLLVKLVTFPLTYKSMKSMKEMAKLQPQLTKLREKYKDDREALNREMMTMMRSHGYNPAAGCLPMLIQMPVFFALYRVLYSSIELYHAPFFSWIHDLSAKDPFYVTPVLLTVTMFFQQKLTPNTAADPAQQKMMQFMPVIFGVMMISLPSGLTLYMLVNTLSGVAQQYFLNRKLGTTRGTALATR